ncbi:cytosolic iron-sulfur protein assembly [Linnemannia zychae]|nr:cytosolic iron-sulfur protein assembly [Linnemannia zychae]
MVGAYGRGSEIRFYDPRATHPRSPLRKINMRSRINAINVSPDGQRFAIAGGIRWKTVQLQDVRSDKPSINLRGHEIDVRCAAFSPCGHWIVSGGRDMTIRIWYSPTGQTGNDWSCVAVVAGCSDTVKCVAWNPVVPMEFVTGSKDRTVRVWRILSNGEGGSEGGRNGGGGGVSVQMVWGSYSGRLISSGVTLKGVTGLNPIYQKLLVQRGAIDDTLSSEGGQVG